MNKIAVKRHPWTTLTREMIDWLIKENPSLEDKELEMHDPLLVKCIEELKPVDFRIVEVDSDEYLTLESSNDVIVIIPKDLEVFKKCFVKIPEQCQTKEQEEQQDS